jgi:hypothetical protein
MSCQKLLLRHSAGLVTYLTTFFNYIVSIDSNDRIVVKDEIEGSGRVSVEDTSLAFVLDAEENHGNP